MASQQSNPNSDDGPSTAELADLVKRGLRKQKKCGLCEQTFFVPELPGAISWKSVLELRKKWDPNDLRLTRIPSPSQLYKRVELCIFCMQFFDVDAADTDGVPFSATTLPAAKQGDAKDPAFRYSLSPQKRRQLQQQASASGSQHGAGGNDTTFH